MDVDIKNKQISQNHDSYNNFNSIILPENIISINSGNYLLFMKIKFFIKININIFFKN